MIEVRHGGNYKVSDRRGWKSDLSSLLPSILGEMKTTLRFQAVYNRMKSYHVKSSSYNWTKHTEKAGETKLSISHRFNHIKNRVEKFYSGFHKKYHVGNTVQVIQQQHLSESYNENHE